MPRLRLALGTIVEVSDPDLGIPPFGGKRSTRRGKIERWTNTSTSWTAHQPIVSARCSRWPRMPLHGFGGFSARDRPKTPHELRAPTAVPAAVESRRGCGSRRHRCCRSRWVRERGRPVARRLRAPRRLGLGLYSRHWLSLARRSAVGARSEDAVQRALAPLKSEGWRLRHSLAWQGRGDIDSVAIAPSGIAVAIETKTRTYDGHHLGRVREHAAWLSRRRRRWARHGALGVMCLVRAHGVERVEHDVLVVSIDRLTNVLRVAAGMRPDSRSRV